MRTLDEQLQSLYPWKYVPEGLPQDVSDLLLRALNEDGKATCIQSLKHRSRQDAMGAMRRYRRNHPADVSQAMFDRVFEFLETNA